MIGRESVPYALSRIALFLLCLSMPARSAQANVEAPAILEFAREYRQQQPLPPPGRIKKMAPVRNPSGSTTVAQSHRVAELERSLADKEKALTIKQTEAANKDLLLARQDTELRQLRQKVTQIQPQSPAARTPTATMSATEISAVKSLILEFRRLLELQPSEKSLSQQLGASRQKADQLQDKVAKLIAANQQREEREKDLNRQIVKLEQVAQQGASQQEAKLRQQINELEKENSDLNSGINTSELARKNGAEQIKILEEQLKKLRVENSANQQRLKSQQAAADYANTSSRRQQQKLLSDQQNLQDQLANAVETARQLTTSREKITALEEKLNATQKQVATRTDSDAKALAAAQAESKNALERLSAIQKKLDDAATQQKVLEQKLKQADSTAQNDSITSAQLRQKSQREAYAIGVSLGNEILLMEAENSHQGTKKDQKTILAGIVDIFKNQVKIPPEELSKTLSEVTKQVKNNRNKFVSELKSATKKYLAAFMKEKNSKKSESGFWYKIDYAGDTAIPKDASLDVIIKESLPDGTVIEDMDEKGIVLTQPIKSFPPVFREALSKLNNHGSITIVVPPELAYGDRGYPPKIPPDATMIYNLRISEVYTQPSKKSNDDNKNITVNKRNPY